MFIPGARPTFMVSCHNDLWIDDNEYYGELFSLTVIFSLTVNDIHLCDTFSSLVVCLR